jgi:hypothetical protein
MLSLETSVFFSDAPFRFRTTCSSTTSEQNLVLRGPEFDAEVHRRIGSYSAIRASAEVARTTEYTGVSRVVVLDSPAPPVLAILGVDAGSTSTVPTDSVDRGLNSQVVTAPIADPVADSRGLTTRSSSPVDMKSLVALAGNLKIQLQTPEADQSHREPTEIIVPQLHQDSLVDNGEFQDCLPPEPPGAGHGPFCFCRHCWPDRPDPLRPLGPLEFADLIRHVPGAF